MKEVKTLNRLLTIEKNKDITSFFKKNHQTQMVLRDFFHKR